MTIIYNCDIHGLVNHSPIKTKKGNYSYLCCNCVIERRRKNKQLCINLAGGKCQKCGYKKYAGALDFHHIDKKTKRIGIARLTGYKLDKIIEELKKCEILCSNCHQQHHHKKELSQKHKSIYAYRRNIKNLLFHLHGSKCNLCHNDNIIHMCFHHINPNEKSFLIGSSTKSKISLINESKKCILVCHNCHRELHAGMHKNFKPETTFNEELYEQHILHEKSLKKIKPTRQCNYCGKITHNKKYCCTNCCDISRRKVKNRPTKEELLQLLEKNPCTAVAKMFSVSDACIKKWLNSTSG